MQYVLAPDGLKKKLVMPSEDEDLAIVKAFRLIGHFDERILDRLKLMPIENQNTKRPSLVMFKQGDQGMQL